MDAVMTGDQIRQSFLDFFYDKEHTIVPSSSLLPDAPNLLFTNAGMNQFVPIFLGERKPDVSKWPGAIPARDTRAANTQKCIRAGGKHNDLEDVGFDTYHHTFFEMLGNWSFGDYFKAEAIQWAWELLTKKWNFPKHRLYATVYKPNPGEPAQLDEEALELWQKIFLDAGLDPTIHIKFGAQKDNFWMMGETGPCGPCSEIHIDLTPEGNSQGKLVNAGTPWCIEIWNLVFIQFNANPDGSFSPLPAQHVDTGMGFERVVAIIQCSRGFKDFSRTISNYETDIFRPLFEKLSQLSGLFYKGTVPERTPEGNPILKNAQEHIDIAFRVIADHIRAISFAIADGILPGNTDRNYVIRRILRRAVRYGRILGFKGPFMYKLVDVLAECMGNVFPEIREKARFITEVIESEEAAFNRTLDRGIELFNEEVQKILNSSSTEKVIPGELAFKLYDTYGFPLDLTQLMARERGLKVDIGGFSKLMEQQRERARKSQKRQVIEVVESVQLPSTQFVGYESLHCDAKIIALVPIKGRIGLVLDKTPFYAEGGGQVGDRGIIKIDTQVLRVVDTLKIADAYVHVLEDNTYTPAIGIEVEAVVDLEHRLATQRHHTATHLLHWALKELLGPEVQQKGSYVGPDKLTFDFNARPISPETLEKLELLVNSKIIENHLVSWVIVPYEEIRHRSDIRQIFGEKYGEYVRVLQIGGRPQKLDGFSMELCGGTHCKSTGEIGLFHIVSESAVAAGIRRIEACAGMAAYTKIKQVLNAIKKVSKLLNSPIGEIERKIEALLEQNRYFEKQTQKLLQQLIRIEASKLISRKQTIGHVEVIIERYDGDAETLQILINELRQMFSGPIFLAGIHNGNVNFIASVPNPFTHKLHAAHWINHAARVVNGGGGGKAELARGGGRCPEKISQALKEAEKFLTKLLLC